MVMVAILLFTGCPDALALLTKVIAAVQIAEQAVSVVQIFADAHVTDPALRDKIDAQATIARAAMAAAQAAAKGGDALAQKSVTAAFNDFGTAYQTMLDLTNALGVKVQDTPKLSARPGGLTVPSVAALRAEMERS